MKTKWNLKTNLIIALFCFGAILYHVIVNTSILTHPYMVSLLLLLFGVGGYNLGLTVRKFVNNYIKIQK